MTKRNIELFSNTPDNTHCVQACLKMVFSHLNTPQQKLSVKQLDRPTHHISGRFTGDTCTILWLTSLGYKVIHYEPLDYVQFALRGEKYLRQIWKPDYFKLQKEMSDLDLERQNAKQLIDKKVELICGTPHIDYLTYQFGRGYACMISVNPYTLDDMAGVGSHMVVLTGYDREFVYFNDPGPVASKKKVKRELFSKAIYSATLIKRKV